MYLFGPLRDCFVWDIITRDPILQSCLSAHSLPHDNSFYHQRGEAGFSPLEFGLACDFLLTNRI